jgi:hypothetical protein
MNYPEMNFYMNFLGRGLDIVILWGLVVLLLRIKKANGYHKESIKENKND